MYMSNISLKVYMSESDSVLLFSISQMIFSPSDAANQIERVDQRGSWERKMSWHDDDGRTGRSLTENA
jgi:hypothetical protein